MYFHFRISLGCVLQYLHLWLHTSLFLIWISLSIIMPHFMQYRSIHSNLNSDHYLNVLLSELCRTLWLGGQAVWRDVSYQHFPSWDLNSIILKLLDTWVLKSPGLPGATLPARLGVLSANYSFSLVLTPDSASSLDLSSELLWGSWASGLT